MTYDPDKEAYERDWCCAPRCKLTSESIFQGKGWCDKHYVERFALNPPEVYEHEDDCECVRCVSPKRRTKEAKPGVKWEQRTPLTLAEAQKPKEEVFISPDYGSIEEYTQKTGKRFRMTKDQKLRNKTREEAFKEIYG